MRGCSGTSTKRIAGGMHVFHVWFVPCATMYHHVSSPPQLHLIQHTQGAEHVCLQGVFHSMSRVGTYSEASDYQWYGSDAVVDAWLHEVVAGKK